MLSEISELPTPDYFHRSVKHTNKIANDSITPSTQAQAENQTHHPCLFWLTNLTNLNLAGINIVIFFFNKDMTTWIASVGSLIFVSLVIFIVNSCKVAPSKKAAFCLYFLLDNLILVNLAALIGFIGMITVLVAKFNVETYIFVVLLGITWFMYTGNFRVTFAYVKWKKYQVIWGKLGLLFASLVYLAIATYFMRFSFNFGPKTDPDAVKDYFFLYIFGLLSLLLEIYSKISDLDGTANLSFRYSFQEQEKELRESEVGIEGKEQI